MAAISRSDTPSPDHRAALYDAFRDGDRPVEKQIKRGLTIGVDRLDADVGFVTAIENGTQLITHVVGESETITTGERCPLDEAYCQGTVETAGLLSVQDAAASPAIDNQAVDRFGLGAYIGNKVVVQGAVVGTVCFADHDERSAPYDDQDELFVELLAHLIGAGLERAEYETELEHRNARLAAEKERFESIADSSFDVIYRVDEQGAFTFVSTAVERVLGYAPAALEGDRFLEHVVPAARPAARTSLERVLAGESVEAAPLAFEDAHGERVDLEITATPVSAEGFTGVQGVARDVTARREREAELRLKTRAMDDASVGITIADATAPDQPLVYVNAAFEAMTGYTEAAALGRNCRFLQGPGTADDAIAALRAAVDAAEPTTVGLLNYRADGTPFWNEVTVTPVRDAGGEVTHFVGFQRDVTERERRQRLVALLNRVLRHNIRNGVNVLMVDSDRLASADQPTGDVAERFQRTANRLAELSDTAAQIEQYARKDRDPRRIDPRALLESVRADQDATEDVTVTTTVTSERDLCVGPEIRAAIEELVANAIAHDDDPPTAIDIAITDDGPWIELTVIDDGPGVPATEVSVIERGEETALEHGSGLGLWLVNWIVTRYGGSFQLAAHGPSGTEGTVARLRLPPIDEETAVEAAAQPPTPLFY